MIPAVDPGATGAGSTARPVIASQSGNPRGRA
jgi:hypothetical protein